MLKYLENFQKYLQYLEVILTDLRHKEYWVKTIAHVVSDYERIWSIKHRFLDDLIYDLCFA